VAGHMDITKLTVALCSFVDMPENQEDDKARIFLSLL
jgi:hypothetical protein